MYNLTELSNNYSKTSGGEQYDRDSPNGDLTDPESLKFKAKITGSTPTASNRKIMVYQYC